MITMVEETEEISVSPEKVPGENLPEGKSVIPDAGLTSEEVPVDSGASPEKQKPPENQPNGGTAPGFSLLTRMIEQHEIEAELLEPSEEEQEEGMVSDEEREEREVIRASLSLLTGIRESFRLSPEAALSEIERQVSRIVEIATELGNGPDHGEDAFSLLSRSQVIQQLVRKSLSS